MRRRNTKSKEEILTALKNAKSALSHDMIQAEVDNIDRATIYRILNRFYEDEVVHRIVGDDGKQYFALCLNCQAPKHNHNHFHFRCLSCGKVECLKEEISVSLPAGFVAKNFNALISGYCSKCS